MAVDEGDAFARQRRQGAAASLTERARSPSAMKITTLWGAAWATAVCVDTGAAAISIPAIKISMRMGPRER
jgi:hypothetical protein